MTRKQRGPSVSTTKTTTAPAQARGPAGACAVCGLSDARGLVEVDLAGEPCIVLCGSHELMHRRSGWAARTVAELRSAFGDRRGTDRRGVADGAEVDELAEALSSAFIRERRGASRRASSMSQPRAITTTE